jgi:protein-S-isoprenylcysteine O-methyltransferase Ste14
MAKSSSARAKVRTTGATATENEGRRSIGSAFLGAAFVLLAITNALAAMDADRAAEAIYRLVASLTWAVLVVLVTLRHRPRRRQHSLPAVCVAIAASVVPIAIGAQSTTSATWRLVVGSVMLIAGSAGTLVAFLTLGRSFGILPDARVVVSRGVYRYVRHPVYTTELLSIGGMALASEHVLLSATAWVVLVGLQVARARFEERTLVAEWPAYEEYRQTVRWRFVPGVC